MAEVGDSYTAALRRYVPEVMGLQERVQTDTAAGPLFFSSVSGTGEPMEAGQLDGSYWRKNLESPVLFSGAVGGILRHVENPVFLEVGPHAALGGPVRQIIAAASNARAAPYFGAMTRGENSSEAFLTAVGRLFELNVAIDFSQITTKTAALAGLPHYPWDHGGSYWGESRIAHEWRFREFPVHPLLGVRQLESTMLEPTFRNMLFVDDAPWLRDHRIEDSIVFPCAGFLAMIGEGIKQISPRHQGMSSGEKGFTIRNMVLHSALVLPEGAATEIFINSARL